MLDIDVAGLAQVSEGGIEIERAPEGITFEPLTEHDAARHARRRRRQVHRAQRGELAARAARPRAEGRRARAAAVREDRQLDSPDGSLFWRLLVVAEEGSRFTPDRGVRVGRSRPRRLLERGRRALRRAGREARVRLAPEPLARDVALRHAPRAGRARRRARLGRRRLRLEEGQDPDPERPRRPGRDLARDRRVLRGRRRSTSTTTRSRSTSPRTRPPTSRSRARSATRRRRSGAG